MYLRVLVEGWVSILMPGPCSILLMVSAPSELVRGGTRSPQVGLTRSLFQLGYPSSLVYSRLLLWVCCEGGGPLNRHRRIRIIKVRL